MTHMQEVIEIVEINVPRLYTTLEEKASPQVTQLVNISFVGLNSHN